MNLWSEKRMEDLSNDELECLPFDMYGDDWMKPDPDEED